MSEAPARSRVGRTWWRASTCLVVAFAASALALLLASEVRAAGGSFTWSKNGNTAAASWRSFEDDNAYMTVTSNARQRTGKRNMYVKIDFYALKCSGGQNTCYSISAAGVVSLNEGAEWHKAGLTHRAPPLASRARGIRTGGR